MASYNRVLLMGNLTRDPVLKFVSNGNPVCEFGLAVNRRYRRQDGEMQEEVCFVDVSVWGRQAESCNQYLHKGSGAFIEGRLQYDSWQTPEGQKRNRLRVVAERVQFLPKGQGGGRGPAETGAEGGGEVSDYGPRFSTQPEGAPEFDSEVPF